MHWIDKNWETSDKPEPPLEPIPTVSGLVTLFVAGITLPGFSLVGEDPKLMVANSVDGIMRELYKPFEFLTEFLEGKV
jgi:hypothetical protein